MTEPTHSIEIASAEDALEAAEQLAALAESLFRAEELAATTAEAPEQNDVQPEPDNWRDADGYITNQHPEYCPNCHITSLIEQVTVTTLGQSGKLEGDSASTLEKLSRIHAYYRSMA